MKHRILEMCLGVATVLLVLNFTYSRIVHSQSPPSSFVWTYGLLDNDQGGSIELGSETGTGANPVNGGLPYIDFHYGNGKSQDYNARVENSADNELSVLTESGGVGLRVNSSDVQVNHGIDATGTGIKHARTSATCETGSSPGDTCTVTLDWPGTAFPDTNYTVVCTPQGNSGNHDTAAYVYVSPSSKTTTSVGVTIEMVSGANAVDLNGVGCIAMHD